MTKKTTEKFIEDSIKKHGNLYDYSKVEYTGNQNNVTIICKIHGEFKQTPNNHLRGSKCPKCLNRNLTTKDYLKKFREVHGNLYTYPNFEYKGSKYKIDIICEKHGTFKKMPNLHAKGSG